MSLSFTLRPLTEVLTDVTLREGSQQADDLRGAPVAVKRKLLSLLCRTGIARVEYTAFAPGEWFSDAHELSASFLDIPDEVSLRALYFNSKGLESLLEYPRLLREGIFHTSATAPYREQNYNQKNEEDVLKKMRQLLHSFETNGLQFDTLVISTAWGEPKQEIKPPDVLSLCDKLFKEAENLGLPVMSVTLADTVGNASPMAISELFNLLKKTFPALTLRAHLHPAAGQAAQSIEAALEAGVDEWEAAWGGVGGSPMTDKPGGNLDIRWLIQAWKKRGVPHGLDMSAVDEALRALGAAVKRRLAAD